MRQARKGDRALVLRYPGDAGHFVGNIVDVLSDPCIAPTHWPESIRGKLCNRIVDGTHWARTEYLIPLPPDAESKRLFAEEPVGVVA